MSKDPKEMNKILAEKLGPEKLAAIAKSAQSSLLDKIDPSVFTPPSPTSQTGEAEIIRLLNETVRLLASIDQKLK
jgi:hypothetical protein